MPDLMYFRRIRNVSDMEAILGSACFGLLEKSSFGEKGIKHVQPSVLNDWGTFWSRQSVTLF